MDTDIFLLDEPTANLDFAATQQLKNILLKLKKQGKTLLLSEHRLYYLADIADEYWIMANGEIKHKYTAEKAKSLLPLQLHTLCLRTLDLEKSPCRKDRHNPKICHRRSLFQTFGINTEGKQSNTFRRKFFRL